MILKNKNVIITGARRGIGRASVEVFAEQGANVWACARKHDEAFETDLASISRRYDVSIWPIYCDLTDEEQVKTAVAVIRKKRISVDALVNVAGIADDSTSFPMTPIDKMKRVMENNFFALTLFTQYVSRIMIRQSAGNIINVSSIAGVDGTPAQYEYAASKGAVIAGTRNLSRELVQYGIRVNAVAPGIVETEMGQKIGDDLREQTLSKIIMRRAGLPKEIANVIAFLASDLSSYMTGQIIRVDGGM